MTATHRPLCVRCGHAAYYHRLDDASGFSPGDPGAPFRCVWPMPDVYPQVCACPDMVVPPDAGWPYNGAPPPEPEGEPAWL